MKKGIRVCGVMLFCVPSLFIYFLFLFTFVSAPSLEYSYRIARHIVGIFVYVLDCCDNTLRGVKFPPNMCALKIKQGT